MTFTLNFLKDHYESGEEDVRTSTTKLFNFWSEMELPLSPSLNHIQQQLSTKYKYYFSRE